MITLSKYKNQDMQVVTVGTTQVAMPTPTASIVVKPEAIFVQSASTNTGKIMIGKTGVTSTFTTGCYELAPGANMTLPSHMYAELFAISTAATQKLLVTYLSELN